MITYSRFSFWIKLILYASFGMMFISTAIGWEDISKMFVIVYASILFPLVGLALVVHFMNNHRINLICKELNISLEEYKSLVVRYGDSI